MQTITINAHSTKTWSCNGPAAVFIDPIIDVIMDWTAEVQSDVLFHRKMREMAKLTA